MQLREEDMFYINVSVPRITRKQVEEMEASIPGLLSVASIPIIEKRKKMPSRLVSGWQSRRPLVVNS